MMNKMMKRRRRRRSMKTKNMKMIFNQSILMNVNLFIVEVRVNALILL